MMISVDVRGVDPRDQTWELDAPDYRVYFHNAAGTSYEYEVSGVDIEQVIAWAEDHREDRSYVLYVCVPGEGLGLVRLTGADPNADGADMRPTPGWG